MASERATPYRETANGISLRIRLTPKSSRDQIGSVIESAEGDVLQAFVRALPKDGAANNALRLLVANWLRIPKSTVRVQSGSKSRIKVVAINGAPAELITKLNQLLSGGT